MSVGGKSHVLALPSSAASTSYSENAQAAALVPAERFRLTISSLSLCAPQQPKAASASASRFPQSNQSNHAGTAGYREKPRKDGAFAPGVGVTRHPASDPAREGAVGAGKPFSPEPRGDSFAAYPVPLNLPQLLGRRSIPDPQRVPAARRETG
jgi:hypothetical protein